MTEANALMKINEWEDAVYYRVGCDCCSPEHDMSIWAEKIDGHEGYEIRMEATLAASEYRSRGYPDWLRWLEALVNRVAIAVRVLLTGRVEVSHEFVLGKANVRGLCTALQDIERKFQ